MSAISSIRPECRDVGTVERAFQLARSGEFGTVEDIRRKLTSESHDSVQAHLSGNAIRNDLRRLISAAGGSAV